MTMREIAQLAARVTSRRRWIMGLPGFMASLIGVSFDALQTVSGGLVVNRVMTRDQARLLRRPNRVGQGVRTFADLGIQPAAAAAVVPEYLWRFRPSGQYTAIKESAKNLRAD